MSTQDANEIAFSLSHKQQAFKLLELPAELLAILESDNPPCLHLNTAPSGTAQLVTKSKIYRVQQKNSSNSIMILAPSTTDFIHQASDVAIGIQPKAGIPESSITVISTVQDTLELLYDADENITMVKKVNKWHEKFGKGRAAGRP